MSHFQRSRFTKLDIKWDTNISWIDDTGDYERLVRYIDDAKRCIVLTRMMHHNSFSYSYTARLELDGNKTVKILNIPRHAIESEENKYYSDQF